MVLIVLALWKYVQCSERRIRIILVVLGWRPWSVHLGQLGDGSIEALLEIEHAGRVPRLKVQYPTPETPSAEPRARPGRNTSLK